VDVQPQRPDGFHKNALLLESWSTVYNQEAWIREKTIQQLYH
jgi:hypothetical protein